MRGHRIIGLSALLIGLAMLVGAADLYVELGSASSSGSTSLSGYADFVVESIVVPLRRGWSDLTGGPDPGPAQFAGAVRTFSFAMGLAGLLLVGVGTWLLVRTPGDETERA